MYQLWKPNIPRRNCQSWDKKKRIEEANKPKDKFELFAEKLKDHKYFLMRLIYKIGYSVGLVFAAIGGAIAWIVAMANA